MAIAPPRRDVSNAPELLHWAKELQRSGVARVLMDGDRDLAVLSPLEPSADRVGHPIGSVESRSSAETPDDSILNIFGLGESTEPTDVARFDLEYLAETSMPRAR